MMMAINERNNFIVSTITASIQDDSSQISQFFFVLPILVATTMGSEQSQPSTNTQINASQLRHPANTSRLTRGNTIAVTGQANHTDDGMGSPSFLPDSSPPISVCSDSDLPYISYTDKPIGGVTMRTNSFFLKFL